MWLGWPNLVSLARIGMVVPFVGCLLLLANDPHSSVRRWAIGIFAVMAISDGLDGYLARRLKQTSALGLILDPLGDKLMITAAVIVLAWAGAPGPPGLGWYRLPIWVVCVLMGKDLLVLAGTVIVYRRTRSSLIAPRALGKVCTTLAFLLILYLLVMADVPARFVWIRTGLIWATGIVAVAASADYVRLGLRLVAGAPVAMREQARV
jgi:cardiolipin synthase